MFYLSSMLLAGGGAQGGGNAMSLVMLVGIMIVFWLFMIRPQAKRAKEQKKMIAQLQKGDKVVLASGIHGTIYKVNEDGTLQLEVSAGMYLKIEKSAISMELTKLVTPKAA